MRCPISLTPIAELKYPVCIRNSSQHAVYKLRELCKWYRVAETDTLTLKAHHLEAYYSYRPTPKTICVWGWPAGIICCFRGCPAGIICFEQIQQLILHEMSTSLVLEPVVDYLAVYRAYADNFERYFCIQSNGTLSPCNAIWMRVRMFPADIMASVHLFSCWLLRSHRSTFACLKNSSREIGTKVSIPSFLCSWATILGTF